MAKSNSSAKKASAQEDADMMAVIMEKAQAGSVDHAKLLADAADYGPTGVLVDVKPNDLQAVIVAITEKADAGNKAAARLLPKLQKTLTIIKNKTPFISRG